MFCVYLESDRIVVRPPLDVVSVMLEDDCDSWLLDTFGISIDDVVVVRAPPTDIFKPLSVAMQLVTDG